MGDLVDISRYLRTCENCRWHGDGTCRRPGGWFWDEQFNRCACFERVAKDGADHE